MTPLPRKGEVAEAAAVMNERLHAAVTVPDEAVGVDLGQVAVSSDGALGGAGADTLRKIYGDLIDPAELTFDAGMSVVNNGMANVVSGSRSLDNEMMSLFMQGAALGVMIERRRWEAERREGRSE